jgi:CHAT domain-containing protein
MARQDWIEHLWELPDTKAQVRFLKEHASLLGDEVAGALKARVDHLMRADSGRALQTARLLLCLAEITGNPLHRALGLLAEANSYCIGFGEYEKAIERYDQAAQIYQSQDRLVDQARSQVGKIGALANLGRYAEALKVGDWASHILEERGEWKTLAVLTMNLGIVHSRAGNEIQSLEKFDRAGVLYQRLGAKGEPNWLLIQQNRAIALRTLGHFKESIRASQVALKGLERLRQRAEAARARQNLALTYLLLGRYNEALEHLHQVRDVFLDDGRQRDAMLVELFISDCLLQLRRFNDVLEKCCQVRSLFAEMGVRDFVAQAIINEAVAYAELDRYTDALASLAEARQVFEREKNMVRVASTDLETATVLQRQRRYDDSLAIAQECACTFEAHDLPVEEAQALLVAARAAMSLERHDHALRLATKALIAGERRNVPTLKYQGHHLLGRLAAVRGAPQDALAAYDRAIEEVERLRGRLMVEFRVGFVEDKEEIYEDAVGLCLDLGQPLQGLEYAERAKSRALLDLLACRLDLSIQARDEGDEPLVKELVRLRAERDRLYRRWEDDGDSEGRGWSLAQGCHVQARQEVSTLEKRITKLWHRLLIRNADYAREAALWTIRTEPAQPYLASDALLIEYFAVHGEMVAFLVTADRVQARRLDVDLAQIQLLVQLLWLNLKAVPKSSKSWMSTLEANAQGILQRLYTSVMAPLADALDAHRQLIIVPHGPLHYLPFHALHDGTWYLLERHEISYLPGASFLRYCEEAQLADSGMLAIGHSHGGHLLHAPQEAQQVAKLMEGHLLLEDQATLAELEQVAPHCRIIHLSAHGDFRPDNPLFSGLCLSDGWLTTLDIFNLRLKASLVTLSACQTGRSVVGGGDELLGLMRAFLCAGAASLVLTLWAVDDQSTAELMATFYRELAEGWTKGLALRRAQLRFLQRRDKHGRAYLGHPYFWAPFFLVGNAGPL